MRSRTRHNSVGTATRRTNKAGVRIPGMSGAQPCGPPALITSGFVKTKGPYYPNGTKAEYSCFTGYQLQGAPYIVCTIGSVWASLPPTCEPRDEGINVDTDVDVRVEPKSEQEWKFLLVIIFGAIIGLALLGLLLAWCCKAFGCFHDNTVLPYKVNHRQHGACCCKRYVLTGMEQSAGRTRPASHVIVHDPRVTKDVNRRSPRHNVAQTVSDHAHPPIAFVPDTGQTYQPYVVRNVPGKAIRHSVVRQHTKPVQRPRIVNRDSNQASNRLDVKHGPQQTPRSDVEKTDGDQTPTRFLVKPATSYDVSKTDRSQTPNRFAVNSVPEHATRSDFSTTETGQTTARLVVKPVADQTPRSSVATYDSGWQDEAYDPNTSSGGRDRSVDSSSVECPTRKGSDVKRPPIWMPHTHPVRNINTSTK